MKAIKGINITGAGKWVVVSSLLALLPATTSAETFEAAVSLRNIDVAEGVRTDVKTGLLLTEAAASWAGFFVGLEYLQSLRENYNEVHLSLGYGLDIGPVAVGLAGTRVDYSPGTEEDTWEISGDLEWTVSRWLVLFIDGMVDVDEVRGGFAETGAGLTPPAFGPDGRFSVDLYALIGWDFGYVSKPRRMEENHWQLGGEIVCSLIDHLELFADAHYSIPLTNLNREDEPSHVWGGVGLRLGF